MPPELVIEDSNGDTKATITCDSVQRTATRGEMDRAQATIPRSDWAGVSVDSRLNRLYIDRADGSRMFGGRYDDDARESGSVTVKLVSFERDAVDAEPTPRGLTFQNVTDDTVIQDAIDGVPSLSAGTLDNVASGLSFSFPNSARSKQIRKVTTATGAEVRYNADRTVDYKSRLGSDRNITITPSNQNIVGSPRVTEDARDEVTHIRGFGSREGDIVAEAVASSYSGGRQVWREFEDTDIKEVSRLQQVIDRMVADYDGEPRKITVEATLVNVDVQRGDRLQVTLSERDIDREMRITTLVERIGQRGREFVATLTNREVDKELEGNPREDLQRFNRGYQGFLDRDQVTSGWQVCGDGHNARLVIPDWPDDIVREETVTVYLQGRPWRSPIDITDHSHNINISTDTFVVQSDRIQEEYINSGVVTAAGDFTVSTPDTASIDNLRWPYVIQATVEPNTTASQTVEKLRAEVGVDSDGDGILNYTEPIFVGTENDDSRNIEGSNGTVTLFDSLSSASAVQLRIEAKTDSGNSVDLNWQWRVAGIAPHAHSISDSTTSDANSGGSATIIESFGGNTYYPQGDLIVNGTTIGTAGVGSDWERSFDITGELSAGQNTIEFDANLERGSVNITLFSELFRRGPTTTP